MGWPAGISTGGAADGLPHSPAIGETNSQAKNLKVGLRKSLTRNRDIALLFIVLSVLGVTAILSTANQLYAGWVNDPLRSVGGFIPLVSLILLVRVWHRMGWAVEQDRRLGLGTAAWCGLALLSVTIAAVHLRDVALAEFVVTPAVTISLPPHQAVALAYVAGIVLVAGGWRLLRAAWFPVLLIVLVIPVPNLFVVRVDLPLQHAAAVTARAFAHAMGQTLSTDALKLMFTPQFGMFIAPGCDGIRGSVTMAILALVAGYVYRLGGWPTAMMTLGGLLLGYVFNLVRLCGLVLYYVVALHVPWLQSRAEMGDYVLGGVLFFVATVLLFSVVQRLRATDDRNVPGTDFSVLATHTSNGAHNVGWWRAGALLMLLALGALPYVTPWMAKGDAAAAMPLADFPQHVGAYRLVRRWDESLVGGQVIFYWGNYTGPAGEEIALGVSPVLGAHDTLLCHVARGEDWLWHGNLPLPTANGETDFSGSFFGESGRQYMEATTLCTGDSCGQHGVGARHFGLIYSRPDARSALAGMSPQAPIPVLLRAYTSDTHLPQATARRELIGAMAEFSMHLPLVELTRPFRRRE